MDIQQAVDLVQSVGILLLAILAVGMASNRRRR